MNEQTIMSKISSIIEDARAGILATVDADGRPHMRWMTPALLQGRTGTLFAVTSPQFAKAVHLASNPEAEWMLQTSAFDEVLNIRCTVNTLDNPSIKAEILEAIGKKLTVFWKVNSSMDLVVLETVLEEAVLFNSMKGTREVVRFGEREDGK